MRRFGIAGLLALTATLAGAQTPPAKAPEPAKPTPTPAERCLTDLPQWQQYAQTLKEARDNLERSLATTTAELTALKQQLAEAQKKP